MYGNIERSLEMYKERFERTKGTEKVVWIILIIDEYIFI